MSNRLVDEVSPYLLAHASNPVDWRPWGEDAFAEARRTGKPILLSIGYSACHWCHVMAHESFEHEATAALMNDLFVNIKVDREERPDVDHVYMAALQSLGQHGGWPLTMFLDPDGRPFWGGTYFPPEPRYGQPAFTQVLASVADAFRNRRADIEQNGHAILAALTGPRSQDETGSLSLSLLDRLATRIRDLHDTTHGGLRGAPKFPNPPVLEFLWRAADRTGDESVRAAMLLTLERMARGGIHDHVGGGFARYSVDERWLVPHFEKMLYDNAQLLPLLALAAHRTRSDLLAHAAEHLVVWLLRDMRTAGGAFASALDADSLDAHGHPEEGAFYTWTPDEVRAVLAAEADLWSAAYDITRGGNFEGRAIPNLIARTGGERPESAIDAATEALRLARDRRAPPARDDKVLADWNGLAITALARAGLLLGRREWIAAATAAFGAVVDRLGGESILSHAWREGKRVHPGFASDHASMGLAALALQEATGDAQYLAFAEAWAATLLSDYLLPETGLIAMSVATATDLPFRPAPTQDDAVPNANALTAELLVRLFGQTGEERWLTAADDLFAAATPAALANPFGHAALLNALDLRLRRADIVAVEATGGALAALAQAVPFTNRTLVRIEPGTPLPKTAAAPRDASAPYALVCAQGRCSLPVSDTQSLRERIDAALQT